MLYLQSKGTLTCIPFPSRDCRDCPHCAEQIRESQYKGLIILTMLHGGNLAWVAGVSFLTASHPQWHQPALLHGNNVQTPWKDGWRVGGGKHPCPLQVQHPSRASIFPGKFSEPRPPGLLRPLHYVGPPDYIIGHWRPNSLTIPSALLWGQGVEL